jgi:hypothetical protein
VVFLSGNESVRVFFLSFVNIYIAIRGSIIKRGVGIPLTGLTPPYVCACPGTDLKYLTNTMTEMSNILMKRKIKE